jgi:hypothetical protein
MFARLSTMEPLDPDKEQYQSQVAEFSAAANGQSRKSEFNYVVA